MFLKMFLKLLLLLLLLLLLSRRYEEVAETEVLKTARDNAGKE